LRPRVLIPVRSIYRDYLLSPPIVESLEQFADLEIVVDPAGLESKQYARLYAGRDAVLTTWNTPLIGREVLERATELKIISHAGGEVRPFISPELFDIRPDLILCNASNVMARPVAEHSLCVTLALLRSLFHFKEWVREDENWWEYDPAKNVSLLEKKVGIVGLGQIAREFIRLLGLFDTEILVYSQHLDPEKARQEGLVKSSLEEIFSTCDVISINAASIPANRHMIDARLLKMIKPGAVLVNNGRGMLIDEPALIAELETGRFSAAIDVTEEEPPAAGNKLRFLPNVLLTPHIGGPVPAQRIWMMQEAVANLKAYFEGKPVRGVVDKQRFLYMA